MPKERRKLRSGAHEPSVKLNSRRFAVQDNSVEHVEIGDAIDIPGTEVLQKLSTVEEDPSHILTKKEKHQQKRRALLERLGSDQSTLSKSHNRRMKRKSKEQIASDFSEIRAAIVDLEDNAPKNAELDAHSSVEVSNRNQIQSNHGAGKIGVGKGATLSKRQRKRALQMEQLRHPLILSNPEFTANPFQTIRTHAQNTIIKHQAA